VDDPFEPFGRPGLGPNVMSYSQVEYDAWLTGKFRAFLASNSIVTEDVGKSDFLFSTLDPVRYGGNRRKMDPT